MLVPMRLCVLPYYGFHHVGLSMGSFGGFKVEA